MPGLLPGRSPVLHSTKFAFETPARNPERAPVTDGSGRKITVPGRSGETAARRREPDGADPARKIF